METRVGGQLLLVTLLCVALTYAEVKRDNSMRCRECHSVESSADCHHWGLCGENEICFAREFTNDDGDRRYHLGCEDKARCQLYHNAELLGILGKRQVNDLDPNEDDKPCYECCEGSDCNAMLCVGQLHVDHGHSVLPSHKCPPTFLAGVTSCYYVGNWGVSWAQGRTECHRRSAELASVNSQAEQDFLAHHLNLNLTNHPQYGYWIGGYYVTALNQWLWLDRTEMSKFSAWGPKPSTNRYDYPLYMVNYFSYPTFREWLWASDQPATASGYTGFICERKFM